MSVKLRIIYVNNAIISQMKLAKHLKKNRKQQKINKSNERENSSRVPHQYSPNDLITLKKPGILRKLTIPRAGPYKVIRQNNNGSILIEKSPTDTENVNIRRISPYYVSMETPID